jgi:hypothetical protein
VAAWRHGLVVRRRGLDEAQDGQQRDQLRGFVSSTALLRTISHLLPPAATMGQGDPPTQRASGSGPSRPPHAAGLPPLRTNLPYNPFRPLPPRPLPEDHQPNDSEGGTRRSNLRRPPTVQDTTPTPVAPRAMLASAAARPGAYTAGKGSSWGKVGRWAESSNATASSGADKGKGREVGRQTSEGRWGAPAAGSSTPSSAGSRRSTEASTVRAPSIPVPTAPLSTGPSGSRPQQPALPPPLQMPTAPLPIGPVAQSIAYPRDPTSRCGVFVSGLPGDIQESEVREALGVHGLV